MTLVACFGRIPRFWRFEFELLDRFELKSSLFESVSDSSSSELLEKDRWSAGRGRDREERGQNALAKRLTCVRFRSDRAADLP